MKCPKNLLKLYIDNRLDEGEKIELDAHLGVCSLCQRELEQMQGMVNLLHSCAAPEPDMQFLSCVMSKIELEPSPWELELSRRKVLGKYLGWGSVFLALALLLALIFIFRGYIGDVAVDGWLMLWSQITDLSLPDVLGIWKGVQMLTAVVVDSLQEGQYFWLVLAVSGLLGLSLAREIVDDVQKVLGYRK